MKILEICPFSAGVCGVWGRVKQESLEFSKLGHEVIVFSSNIEKGTNKTAPPTEKFNGIQIRRFSASSSILSKNVKYWFEKKHFFELRSKAVKELENFNPDIIITHLLHPHSANVCRRIKSLKDRNPKIKIFIVPHAPFNVKRGFLLNLVTLFWRKKSTLNLDKFDKIILITNWEKKNYSSKKNKKLGVSKDKIEYIPNGIPEEFFIQKKSEEKNKVLFLGRIAPVKNLETLIFSAKKLPKIEFSIVGLAESEYLKKLNKIKPKNVKIYSTIYDLKKKIKLIDEHKIFVLPSKREAMPQSLIEAMARGKVVISSDTDGGKEIINDNQNGFLFEIGNVGQLIKLIKENIKGNKETQKNAKDSVKKYSWENLIKKYLALFEK